MQKFYDEEPSSDLQKNGFEIDCNYDYSISVATLSIKSDKKAKMLQKEIGDYCIINSPLFHMLDIACFNYTQKILVKNLKKFISKKPNKVLVVGLGNQQIEADAFGGRCTDKIKLKQNIFAIKPNVYANTNLMSFDIVAGVCNQLKPDLVVLIDSLGTQNIKRLACSFQICNVGILPGGALGDFNKTISKQTLGIPCVVIGVPLMIFASGLNNNLEEFYKQFIFTPKDIQDLVDWCAELVSNALNLLC